MKHAMKMGFSNWMVGFGKAQIQNGEQSKVRWQQVDELAWILGFVVGGTKTGQQELKGCNQWMLKDGKQNSDWLPWKLMQQHCDFCVNGWKWGDPSPQWRRWPRGQHEYDYGTLSPKQHFIQDNKTLRMIRKVKAKDSLQAQLQQCPGRFSGMIGRNPSISKSNQSNVVILWFSFIDVRYIP